MPPKGRRSIMKIGKISGVLALALMLPLAGCEMNQTEEGELPDVEVEEEGNLPEYDVEGPEVDVETDTMQIQTPDVDVREPESGNEGGSVY